MTKYIKAFKISSILVGLILAILQTSFFPTLFGAQHFINLVGALCFAYMLRNNFDQAYKLAFYVGIFLDLVSVGLVGMTPLTLSLYVIIFKYINGFYIRGIYSRLFFSTFAFFVLRIIYIGEFRLDVTIICFSFISALLGYFFSIFIRTNYDSEQKVNF